MDSIKQNLENAKNKGKDYYNQMTGQQSMSISFLSFHFFFLSNLIRRKASGLVGLE